MSSSTAIPKRIEDALVTHRRGFSRKARDCWRSALACSERLRSSGAEAQSGVPTASLGPYRDPDFHQIDSWIVVHENNTATFYVGTTDPAGYRDVLPPVDVG